MATDSDITGIINKTGCYCLNEDPSAPHSNLFGFENDGSHILKSDADEQLLLSLTFTQNVRLTGIQFSTLSDGTAPSIIKIFTNRP